MIVWVHEVDRRPLYWLNEKPLGREFLSGIEKAMVPGESPDDFEMTVILDSRVPIDEINQIDLTLDKIPIKHVRYFVHWAGDPRGMLGIELASTFLPLPELPPRVGTSR